MNEDLREIVERIGVALLGVALGWISLWPWRGLIEQPDRFIEPALTGGLIIAVIGGLGRARRLPFPVVLLAQLVASVCWLRHRYGGGSGLRSWLPDPDGIRNAVDVVVDGAEAINTYAAPVATEHGGAVAYLLVLAVALMLGIDLLAFGLRRVSWAGLPVVVSLTVPVSILETGLAWTTFSLCALVFVMLMSTEETARMRAWAQEPRPEDEDVRRPHARRRRPAGAGTTRVSAARIGVVAIAGALVLPPLIPVGDGILGIGPGKGGGGGNDPVRLINPIVDLHRDLTRGDPLELLYATTEDTERRYLRLTVLDEFDGERWKPSRRDLPARNQADGILPAPPGQGPGQDGRDAEWSLQLTGNLRTAWLPAPAPLRSVEIDTGDWRYDSRTLDFVRVDEEVEATVSYQALAFHPEYQISRLESASSTPASVLTPMTDLPGSVPEVVEATARRVTAGGAGNYQKMVLLQNWFRNAGGFTYSLEPEGDVGSSTDALVDFITTDKIGYCEQFAAAMAVMARSLNIPARVVVGFLGPEERPGGYVYTSDSLHAWPEIYFGGTGWVRFEPTPGGRTGAAPAWTQQDREVEPSAEPTPTTAPTAAPTRDVEVPEVAQPETTSDGPHRGYLGIGLAVLVMIGLGSPGVLRSRRRHRRLTPAAGVARDEAAGELWLELLDTAVDLGVPVPEGRSMRQILTGLAEWAGPDAVESWRSEGLARYLEQARYDRPEPIDPSMFAEAADTVRAWQRSLAAATTGPRRLRARLAPTSLFLRRGPVSEVNDLVATAGR